MYKVLFDFASQKTIEYMLFDKKKKKKRNKRVWPQTRGQDLVRYFMLNWQDL